MEVLENKTDVERSYLLLHVNIIYRNASSGMSRNLINFLLCEGVIGGGGGEASIRTFKCCFKGIFVSKFLDWKVHSIRRHDCKH